MPIYEYECTSCHHLFDLIQKFNDAPVTLCPNCSKETVIKLVSAAGFQLKGTGWYATDFKNKDKPKPAHSEKKEDSSKTSDTTTQPAAAAKPTSSENNN